ncbi:hypothetical protein LOAG_15766 [Loa loa]|uniref:Uncharacterized protein n=1 Tax=Loa loa TaxID=7209 RepID=A0A1S0TG75_LOALO|nr:hypothetical protein LOAG_15766 [Loa loa]EFO12767.1 hypothetical protein LOAG_15766 [Loa loa]
MLDYFISLSYQNHYHSIFVVRNHSYISIFQVTMIFFALSAIWHCFTWPNPMDALQWNFSVRPQVNIKPQMSLITKSHSTPQLTSSYSNQNKPIRSQSQIIQCKMNGKMDVGVVVRLKNILLDHIFTAYEIIINLLSLANSFATTIFG